VFEIVAINGAVDVQDVTAAVTSVTERSVYVARASIWRCVSSAT